MTPVVDSSSPALAAQTSISATVTTASFTPPAGCLLVAAAFCSQNATGMTFTISDSLSLAWSTILLRNSTDTGTYQSAAGLYYAVATGAAMTVTCVVGSSFFPTVKVYCITGADMSSPIGGSVKTGSTSTSFATSTFVNSRAASLGIVCAAGTTANAYTSNDTTYGAGPASNGHYGLSGYKTLGAAAATSSFHIETSGTPKTNVVSCEIKSSLEGGGSSFMPFFGHHLEPHDELAARRVHRRHSGLYVPDRRDLTVARAA